MAGRKGKPLAVIIGGGNKSHLTKKQIAARAEAESKYRPAADKIVCPKWLNAEGQKEWKRIVKDLKAIGLLTNIDTSALALYCDAYAKYVEASRAVDEAGSVVEFTNALGATNRIVNPSVAVMQRMAQQIKSFGSEFGLSPGARLRLVVPKGEEKPKSELEQSGFGDV